MRSFHLPDSYALREKCWFFLAMLAFAGCRQPERSSAAAAMSTPGAPSTAGAIAAQPSAAGPSAGAGTGPWSAGHGGAGRAAGAAANARTPPTAVAQAGASAANSGAFAGFAGSATAGAGGLATESTAGELTEKDGIYTFELGRRRLVVDATHGARITRFGLDEHNLLTGPDIDPVNHGSTFWPSPQQRWGWPPVPELDSEPYEVEREGDSVRFVSRSGMRAKVSVTKRIRAMTAEDSVEVSYVLANDDTQPVAWAPWEITRVAARGLSFFPSGPGGQVSAQLPVVEQDGVTWFQHDPDKLGSEGQKLTADGAEGWLAHVAGGLLLVKQFVDVPPAMQAPAPEAEVALYAAQGYVEIEPQGPYTELAPGEQFSWTVRWSVVEVPVDVSAELGNPALVELARQLVARGAT